MMVAGRVPALNSFMLLTSASFDCPDRPGNAPPTAAPLAPWHAAQVAERRWPVTFGSAAVAVDMARTAARTRKCVRRMIYFFPWWLCTTFSTNCLQLFPLEREGT